MSAIQSFFERLETIAARRDSLLCVGLDPQIEQIPPEFQRSDGDLLASLLAWNQAVVESTHDLVCAYKPNIAFYEALGMPGLHLLRETLASIPAEVPVILDAKRGDIGTTAAAYATAVFDEWRVDAVTLSPYLGRDSLQPFVDYQDKGLFVLCHTSNPGAGDFQELEVNDWRTLDREPHQPLYIHVARAISRWADNIGLVVGATFPEAIRRVREVAPERWFLVPGIGAQGGDLEATIEAGCRPAGDGILINASRAIAQAADPRRAALELRSAINTARDQTQRRSPAMAQPPEMRGTTLGERDRRLTEELMDLGAVKFGSFTLASGMQSPIYIDLRLLVSAPSLLALAAEAYAEIIAEIECDRIAGVPYAALPIGTAVSLQTGIPLIYLRKETKAHGLGKDIEGAFEPGEKAVIVEDLITSGGSTIKTAERLRAAGVQVEHAVVLIDREQGGVENLHASGITAHCVFTLSRMLDHLETTGRLEPAQVADVRTFIEAGRHT